MGINKKIGARLASAAAFGFHKFLKLLCYTLFGFYQRLVDRPRNLVGFAP